jgi:pimeloyl-ACP methyl ester carboxylesterase
MAEHRITTPHGTVAVVDHGGDGPSVLLLHGGGRTLADWELVRPHLRGRRVVAADLRWHGFSSDEGDVSLEANADDAEAIIDALQAGAWRLPEPRAVPLRLGPLRL